MTAASDSDSETGIYTVQIKVSLDDYPEISAIADFSVIVNPCTVDVLEFTAGPADQRYKIEDPTQSLGFLTTSQGVCTYEVTYELVTPKSFISIDQTTGEVIVQTDDFEDEDLHKIEIKAKISIPIDVNRTYYDQRTSVFTFELDLYLPIDPCTITVFDELVL